MSARPFEASAKAYLSNIGLAMTPVPRRPLLPLSVEDAEALVHDVRHWNTAAPKEVMPAAE
jgi:dihydrodipicolinate synthase/N-acetylneuraminate lyase